ncbi:hypothetical protein Q3304_08660 [Clostridioides sp. GD02377]|uniref:hypothetical protein n=1 Tax=unclassified Clostridioides TaxID=2635829 RepID=UPI0038B07776
MQFINMANIFKEIEKEQLKIKKSLLEQKNNDKEYAILIRRKKLLDIIDCEMKKYTWLTNTKLISKVDYFINNYYSYELLAEKFSTTIPSAKSIISRAGKIFKDAIGERILREAFGNDISFGDRDLSEKLNLSREQFLLELRSKLPEAKYSEDITLLDCKRELSFLSYFTLRSFHNNFSTLSMQHLSHIMWFLEKENSNEKSDLLHSYLKDKIDLQELMKLIEEVHH